MIISSWRCWLMSLLFLLMMPVGMLAQYDISVAGTTVTSANASNVLGDGKVSFEPTTYTLTLNGAVINLSSSTPYAVSSGIKDLKIKLIGENVINASSSPVFDCEPDAEEGNLTFTTEKSTDASGAEVYGSLLVNGIHQYDNLAERYTIQNTWAEEGAEGWYKEEVGTANTDKKYVRIFYSTNYDLWVGGTQVSTANANNVLGDENSSVSYDNATNTLTLNDVNISVSGKYAIESGLDNLTVLLVGDNVIACQGENDIAFKGTVAGAKITFDTNASSPGSLQVQVNDNHLFDGITLEYADILEMVNEGWSYTIAVKRYGLSIGEVDVTAANATDVLDDGTVSFNITTNTLTLNGAELGSQLIADVNVSIVTSLAQLNINLIGENESYAIKAADENCAVTFKSAEANRGAARLNFWNDANPYFIGFGENKVTYEDGLCLRENKYNSSFSNIVALYVPKVVTEEKERGLYYPDHEFVFSLAEEVEGFDIYYANQIGGGNPVKTTDGKIQLGVGNYVIRAYPIYSGMDTESSRNYQFASEISAKVIAKPTFTVANGTYNEAQKVMLENIPEQNANTTWIPELQQDVEYPQVWYYLNDVKNDSIRYDAEQGINVTESCKVSVYVIDVDSSHVIKSEPVEAQYVIRQEPGYHFSTSSTGTSYINNGSTVSNLEYGSEDNVLPWLINVPEGMTITYGSEDVDVASISETGEITLTGAGYVWITASSAETDLYKAHVERIRLEIRPSDPTISLEHGIYYTGEEVTLTPTVPNGTMYYSFGENGELVEYNDGDVIELPKGDVELYAYTHCGAGDEYMQSYGNGHTTYFVYDKPTFSVDAGTYDESQNVTIGNLPTDGEGKVYYYFYDETLEQEDANMIEYHANDVIQVTESSILKALIARVDTGKQIKTEPVEAEYVIRQEAGLQYSSEYADYTIGGENNSELPELVNENELAVTYSSDNENVATVNAETGEVTIVGMGETTITATSEETDELLAGEASYTLTVYKDLNHSDITVTLSELTYNGHPQTPTVTVKDGETTLNLDEQYSIIEPEAGNTNAIAATAEGAPYITLVSADAMANYYVGSREVKFGIAPKQLEASMVQLSATTLPYSGENQKPTVTVADGELMTADDYTITNEGGVAVGEYTVTVVAKNNYTGTVEKSFEIITRTLEVGKDVNFATEQTWASYYTTTEDLMLPEGLMAYIVTAVGEKAVTVKAINYVPKDVPVLIENGATTTTENTSAEGNLLVGTASATSVSAIEGNVYVLYNNGFTRATSGSIPAHRAYLVLEQAADARLSIFEEDVTGVEATTKSQQTGNWYKLDGRKLSAEPTKKGLYIMNGKKIVVK